ncbi:MAG: hypothetical protein ACRC9T_06105, partial [Vibrionaceae bacterium]
GSLLAVRGQSDFLQRLSDANHATQLELILFEVFSTQNQAESQSMMECHRSCKTDPLTII